MRIGWRGATLGDAIGAVYEVYAARRGKTRWGDKTPLYMQYLGLLDRLFPTATYAHLIRDGRDAAMSYLTVPAGIMTESWGHPRDVTGFACQWRRRWRPPGPSGERSARHGTSSFATSRSSVIRKDT